MHRKQLIVGGAVLALAAGGAGAASAVGSDDHPVAGDTSSQARAAALRYTGGGSAGTVEADSEHGATWGVEVTKPDGSPVDVRLDGHYKLVEITSNAEG